MINKPEKVFPCDCQGEGLVVNTCFEGKDSWGDPCNVVVSRDSELEDQYNYYSIEISFWGFGPYTDGRLSFKRRIQAAWHILKYGHPWTDMVGLSLKTAKNFANNILHKVEQIEKKLSLKKYELNPPFDKPPLG